MQGPVRGCLSVVCAAGLHFGHTSNSRKVELRILECPALAEPSATKPVNAFWRSSQRLTATEAARPLKVKPRTLLLGVRQSKRLQVVGYEAARLAVSECRLGFCVLGESMR